MRVVSFPEFILDEEIMEITFKDNLDDIIHIKTKHLNLYELDISDSEAVILSKKHCAIETRSIFGNPKDFLTYFDSVKLFMENQ